MQKMTHEFSDEVNFDKLISLIDPLVKQNRTEELVRRLLYDNVGLKLDSIEQIVELIINRPRFVCNC